MAFENSLFLILPLILSLSLPHPTSGGDYLKEKELVIGSRPPQCFNKCLNCRPCVAALVISQRHKESGDHLNHNAAAAAAPVPNANLEATRLPKDDSYYLLSWKCKCKDKYFQP